MKISVNFWLIFCHQTSHNLCRIWRLHYSKFPLPLTIIQILAVDLGTDMLPALGLGAGKPEPRQHDKTAACLQWTLTWLAVIRSCLSVFRRVGSGCGNGGVFFVLQNGFVAMGWCVTRKFNALFTKPQQPVLVQLSSRKLWMSFCAKFPIVLFFKGKLFDNPIILLWHWIRDYFACVDWLYALGKLRFWHGAVRHNDMVNHYSNGISNAWNWRIAEVF